MAIMENKNISRKTYAVVWVALLLLLAANCGLAQLKLGRANLAISFAIAFLQALLMLVYMMHAKISSGLVRLFMAVGFIWLVIMFDLTLSDYLTRGAAPETMRGSWKHGAWPSKSFPATNEVEEARPVPAR